MNSIVTRVDPLLFLGASVTCKTGGHIGGLVLSVLKAQVRRPEHGSRADLSQRPYCETSACDDSLTLPCCGGLLQLSLEAGQNRKRLSAAPVTSAQQSPEEGKGLRQCFPVSRSQGAVVSGQTSVMDSVDQSWGKGSCCGQPSLGHKSIPDLAVDFCCGSSSCITSLELVGYTSPEEDGWAALLAEDGEQRQISTIIIFQEFI